MTGTRPKIKKILIANRGEIARRIIRTCRILDIETVAIFSSVDRYAPHVREASEAIEIGDPLAYLSVVAVVQAAKKSSACAVHPGYGFLSENPALPEALLKEGIRFIGPDAETIRELGSKTKAKAIALSANVPTAPTLLLSSDSMDHNLIEIEALSKEHNFPLMIKAAAGGGGRGMRIVYSLDDARDALESASREALKAFGSGEVFVEKFLSPARHIEVQIAGDSYGSIYALGTRDCSLQRNNQKIIEEAPAIRLKAGVTDELCQAACRLAKIVGYESLGTVEFLYTDDGAFYFLEVNTRLQVEHPVTEQVTGLDLVKLQIDIANGLTLEQSIGSYEPPLNSGHAIEVRLCAEEYTDRFISATGTLLECEVPRGPIQSGLIRADMGYDICSTISHHYDSLIGKIIAYAPDRAQAIKILKDALSKTRISGVGTNRSLLLHLLNTESFRELKHSVQATPSLLPTKGQLEDEWITAHAILAAARLDSTDLSSWLKTSPWGLGDNSFRHNIRYPLYTTNHGYAISSESCTVQSSLEDGQVSQTLAVEIKSPIEREILIRCTKLETLRNRAILLSVSLDRASPIPVTILRDGRKYWVHTPAISISLNVESPPKTLHGQSDIGASVGILSSPIPGKVLKIAYSIGDDVTKGDLVVVLDSMKMEHQFRAPLSGKIIEINVIEGAVITAGTRLLAISG
jgi:propionyl-CoA carboxylase alpha chain